MIENNNLAMWTNADANRIRNYLCGTHNVLGRQDFEFNNKTFHTAKILLNSLKQIVTFHSSYVCGNPVSLSGDMETTKLLQSVYKGGHYDKVDYDIVTNLVKYGNAYEFIYKEKGKIKSRLIPNTDAFPIYENGNYIKFIERFCYNPVTDDCLEREYTRDYVKEYRNGQLVKTYRNASHTLPIHYGTLDKDKTGVFSLGLVSQLIPIMDEIEQLLSKMSDSVTTLSMNPMGVVSGQRIDDSVHADMVGTTLNLDDGGTFNWATANLDYNSIKLLLDSLINQFYQIACVPSALYGQGNVANISETSLELLFNNSDSYAKQLSFGMSEGFEKRLEAISYMLGVDVTSVDINFNYNRPVDNKSMLEAMKTQYDMGAISIETVMKNSPYTQNIDRELELIENRNKGDLSDNVE